MGLQAVLNKVNGVTTESDRARRPDTTGTGTSFGYSALIVAALAAIIEFVSVNGIWVNIFPSVAVQEWFVVLVGHLPAGILLIGTSWAWISSKVDSGIWARPGAWAIGIIGYSIYITFAENLIAPLALFLSNYIPMEYSISAASLIFWALMVLAITKCTGRFVLSTPVGISPNVIALIVILFIAVVVLNGAGPTLFHDFIYGVLDAQTADQFMAIVDRLGATVASIDPMSFMPSLENANPMTHIVIQIISILLKYLPQLLVSVILLNAFTPRR